MTASNDMSEDWTTDVIRFLSQALPTCDHGDGWDHYFMTAYQIGCDALVALGQAKETDWGAVPSAHPRLPNILPRWDDICVAVLFMAGQNNLVEYRRSDVSAPSSTLGFTVRGAPPAPPNIAASHGLGPARAAPELLQTLVSLNLVANGQWTDVAETVLWRDEPKEWQMNITADPRFVEAVTYAFKTMPEGIRVEIVRLVSITEADLAEKKTQLLTGVENMRAEYGPQANIHTDVTPEGLRRSLEFSRRHDLDWLFFRRWRLPDGWLTSEGAKKTLNIFHDPLAIAMRRAVIARLFPGLSFMIDGPRQN